MPCYQPLGAFHRGDGKLKLQPKKDFPAEVFDVIVPCGRCIGCRENRTREWAQRIHHESITTRPNCFLTLTYDDDHLPDGLQLRDWQLFAKRARERFGKMRFFHAGEYGSETQRPHYHAAIFGLDWSDSRKKHKKSNGHWLYTSDDLDDCWSHGHVLIGDITYSSASYIASYICDKLTGPLAVEKYGDRRPEYATMSRNPGIGKAYFERYWRQIYRRDEVIINGKAQKPAAYYDYLLEKTHPAKWEEIKAARLENAKKLGESEHYTERRLLERGEVRKSLRRFWRKKGAPQ